MHLLLSITLLLSGLATRYDDGVMEQVYKTRIALKQITPCPECIGTVAVLDRELLNQKLWFTFDGNIYYGPMHIIDCAAQSDYTRLKAKDLVVELDYQTWHRLNLPAMPVDISITLVDPKLWHPDYYEHNIDDFRR